MKGLYDNLKIPKKGGVTSFCFTDYQGTTIYKGLQCKTWKISTIEAYGTVQQKQGLPNEEYLSLGYTSDGFIATVQVKVPGVLMLSGWFTVTGVNSTNYIGCIKNNDYVSTIAQFATHPASQLGTGSAVVFLNVFPGEEYGIGTGGTSNAGYTGFSGMFIPFG